MGNCIARCFGISSKRRKYLRTRYSVERDISVEFENLMEDDPVQDEVTRLVTEREKQLLASKQYTNLIHEQKRIDAEIDKKLAQQEEDIRLEEEKFYEAKREAARIAKLQKAKEKKAKTSTQGSGKSWLGENEKDWDVAGGEDDFELFLANVKARSLKTTARLREGDGQSSNSSGQTTTHSKDRSQADGSSLDLEWENEDGIPQMKKDKSSTDENAVSSSSTQGRQSPINSNDLEWDNDFVSAEIDTSDTAQLLAAEMAIQKTASR
ncbi:AP-1 complex-associated regulatory protein-like [Saccostrea echinata]|uniref:AP-1 complex-associated regulatory protein-like n=1 Tax=Saccostrea echinata TaxID=191078 RepID=UPI002A804DA8|nr:AP-1 complex-associated regulatory protein-like [Saccostrea echinata]